MFEIAGGASALFGLIAIAIIVACGPLMQDAAIIVIGVFYGVVFLGLLFEVL